MDVIQDDRFWRDLWHSIVYAGTTISLQIIFGIAIALILNQKFYGRDFLRGVSVVPYIMPPIVVAIGWQWMLNENWGIINQFIYDLGLQKINFFSIDMAMITVILISVWIWTPFVVLVFLAGLQTVSEELYESASLDGANSWQQFWKITLPMLKEVIITIILLRGIWMFNKFDMVWLLTGGGPLEKTETLPIYIYMNIFHLNRVGYGSAIAVTSLITMIIGMLIYLKIFNVNQDNKKSWKRKRARKWLVGLDGKEKPETGVGGSK